jgi:hypothetical protein
VSDCPRRDEIRSLVAGKLDASAAEALLDHIAGCDLCLEETDARWAESPALRAFPNPDPSLQAKVERLLLARLGRSDLSGQSILLATLGLVKVVLGLLTPVFAFFNRPTAGPSINGSTPSAAEGTTPSTSDGTTPSADTADSSTTESSADTDHQGS